MNLIREIIRRNIECIAEEELNEALFTKHFIDRLYDRLESTVWTNPPFTDKLFQERIGLLEKIDFSKLETYAIKMGKYKEVYMSKNPENNKVSSGDELWVVVRYNHLVSVFFRNSSQRHTPVADVDYLLNYNDIELYYLRTPKKENGHVDLSHKSLNLFKQKNTEKEKFKPKGLDFPTVELGGKLWYIDEKNDIIINVKNWNKKIPINSLSEKDLEKVVEYI